MIRCYHGGGRGWGTAEQLTWMIHRNDGQRAWVPGIRINQLIVSEFPCGPVFTTPVFTQGDPVFTTEEAANQEGTPELLGACHSVTSAKGEYQRLFLQ